MKLVLISLLSLVSTLCFGLSYWNAETELWNINIEEISYTGITEKKFTEELISLAKKQGYDIEIINKGDPADFSRFKKPTILKNIDLYHNIRFAFLDGSNQLYVHKLTSRKHLRVIIYNDRKSRKSGTRLRKSHRHRSVPHLFEWHAEQGSGENGGKVK